MPTRKLFYALGLCLLALPASAQQSTRSMSADGATVGFANLSNGDVVPPSFTVKFSISGMGIAPAGAEIENTGHHHLLIDVEQLPPLDQPLPATENIRHFGKGQSQAELQLTEGEHSLQLLLADHAHIPHDPPVMSKVIVITVSADAPLPAEANK
jgi:hypothetical protein